MARKFNSWFYLICFFFLAGLATSSSFISNDALDVHGGSGRTLLQMKKPCNVSFENLDYSVLTDKCKGPQYPAKSCCDAFKEFACPFSDAINDLETDCASTMFSYINLYGKYPPGLFANECREDKNGLDCQNVDQSKKSRGVQICSYSILIVDAHSRAHSVVTPIILDGLRVDNHSFPNCYTFLSQSIASSNCGSTIIVFSTFVLQFGILLTINWCIVRYQILLTSTSHVLFLL